MNFEYENNEYGKACLKEAQKSKAKIGFGAVLVKNGKIMEMKMSDNDTDAEIAKIKNM